MLQNPTLKALNLLSMLKYTHKTVLSFHHLFGDWEDKFIYINFFRLVPLSYLLILAHISNIQESSLSLPKADINSSNID